MTTKCLITDFFVINVVQVTENFFYKLGVTVATHPWKTIAYCWLFVAVCACGLIRFHQEKNPLNLWVPPQSTFNRDTRWLMERYKTALRPESMIVTAPNVLNAHVLAETARIVNQVKTFTYDGLTWEDVCFKIPVVDSSMITRNKRSEFNLFKTFGDFNFDPSIKLHPRWYCAIVASMRLTCYEENLLDLWRFDEDVIGNLTRDDIVDAVNGVKISPVTGQPFNYTALLSGVKRNETGHIIAAEALLTNWLVYVDFTKVDMDVVGNDVGTADWATEDVLTWEQGYLKRLNAFNSNVSLFYESSRSFGDISSATMFQDIDKLSIGIFLMTIYVQFVISNFNWLEARVILGGLGLMCVGMAFISAIGICSLLGISYGPVHTSLPFLLMGLGIDDMFVIMASWTQTDPKRTTPERVGHALKHAGVSITVTSLTDVTAFIISAFTILPSLQSFCLYAAAGVFLVFAFAVTFFVACFVLDQRRVQCGRNGFVPFVKHVNYQPAGWSRVNYTALVFKRVYEAVIFTGVGKTIVLGITLTCACFSLTSVLELKQHFDTNWFIPSHTYLHRYLTERNHYFPGMGYEALIIMGNLNYSHELLNIHNLYLELNKQTAYVNDVNTWTTPFFGYLDDLGLDARTLGDDEWRQSISQFLFSPRGARFQANFQFDTNLTCGQAVGDVLVSTINFRFNTFTNAEETIPAMNIVQELVANANITTGDRFVSVWAKVFASWVTHEVIDVEVSRNLMLALICVMLCTIVLIANVQMCVLIFVCVLLTMVNVCGFMQRWGLTIDLVACIGLELAIGLCVDYATHVGHTFLTITRGTRQARAVETVTTIGAAVVYGGFSTLLALSMMSQSDAYVFQAFFKIFLLVVIFGLFHGVVFLPVVLSLIGPECYSYLREEAKEEELTVMASGQCDMLSTSNTLPMLKS